MLPPIVLADTPLPAAPLTAAATNLQTAHAASGDPIPAGRGPGPPRPRVHCVVAPGAGVRPDGMAGGSRSCAPTGRHDLPGRATRRAGRRLGTGARRRELDARRPGRRHSRPAAQPPGCELMEAFPDSASRPSGADLDLTLVDAFAADDAGRAAAGPVRALPRAGDRRGRAAQPDLDRDDAGAAGEAPAAAAAGQPDRNRSREVTSPACRSGCSSATRPTSPRPRRPCSAAATTPSSLRWGWHEEQREQDPSRTASSACTPHRRWMASTGRCSRSPRSAPAG